MPSVFQNDRKALFILTALLLVIGLLQAQNMFKFPYYHDEEGIHMADGLSLATTGQLSPYTYSYEDPPAGSMLVALWTSVTGGVDAFGFSLNSGRVLMLIMHLISTALIFMIAKKLAKNDFAAVIALLVFAFSPLATSLQRVLLLENIMIVWVLAAMYLSVGERRTLMRYFAAAIFIALAVLTKGAAIFFVPALYFSIRSTSDQHHRRFATMLWLAIALLLISFYPLYAQMKEELFPEGSLLGGDFPHVSLMERWSDRGPDTGRFLNYASGLSDSAKDWINLSSPNADPVLIYAGLISAVFVMLLAIDDRNLRPLVLMLLAVGAEMLFGGPVYNGDVILLLPFLALSVGVIVGKVIDLLNQSTGSPWKYALMAGAFALLLYPFWSFNATRLDAYTVNQVDGQIEATDWVNANLPTDAVIVTDNYAFVSLRETHPNVHNYWRVDTDPAVQFEILHDDVCSIDYVITTPQIFADVNAFGMDLMQRTLNQSSVLKTYENNGWQVEIRQVNKANCAPRAVNTTAEN